MWSWFTFFLIGHILAAIVAFDAIVIADGARTVAEISHSAIWRPRQVVEAATG